MREFCLDDNENDIDARAKQCKDRIKKAKTMNARLYAFGKSSTPEALSYIRRLEDAQSKLEHVDHLATLMLKCYPSRDTNVDLEGAVRALKLERVGCPVDAELMLVGRAAEGKFAKNKLEDGMKILAQTPWPFVRDCGNPPTQQQVFDTQKDVVIRTATDAMAANAGDKVKNKACLHKFVKASEPHLASLGTVGRQLTKLSILFGPKGHSCVQVNDALDEVEANENDGLYALFLAYCPQVVAKARDTVQSNEADKEFIGKANSLFDEARKLQAMQRINTMGKTELMKLANGLVTFYIDASKPAREATSHSMSTTLEILVRCYIKFVSVQYQVKPLSWGY
jgi:hypothetical protein